MSHKLNNYNTNWKKLLGFRNMPKKLENAISTEFFLSKTLITIDMVPPLGSTPFLC